MIRAMHDQLLFKMCHFRQFLQTSPELVEVIVKKLYAAVESVDRMAIFDLLPRKDHSRQFRRMARSHFFFHEGNPTDHYELNLHSPTDHSLAERIAVLNVYDQLVGDV